MGRARWMAVLLMLVMVAGIFGCKDEDPFAERRLKMVGNWRHQHRSVHTVMSFRHNGSWSLEKRVEGRYSRIVEKRGQHSGTWTMEGENLVRITVDQAEGESDFTPGMSATFTIKELRPELLVWVDGDGESREWFRIRVQKPEQGEFQTTRPVKLKPFLVNLRRSRELEKERYLGIELELIVRLSEPIQAPTPLPPPPTITPELRERILLFLSDLTYADVNNFERVQKMRSRLEVAIAPWLDAQIDEIKLANVVIASSRESREEFILQYPDLAVEYGLMDPPPVEDEA